MSDIERPPKPPVLPLSAQMRVAVSVAAPEIRGFAAMIEQEWLPEAERLEGAVAEAEKWKRIAQGRCTCVAVCGDTHEESGGICKLLPRGGQ